jgi:tetratricopeptide (TPR) repeat protein
VISRDAVRPPPPALLLAALVILGTALYLPAAGAPPLPDEGERLAGLASGTPAEALGYRENLDEFRPVANLLRHALLAVGGTPASIRVSAALLHGVSALMVFLLVRTLLARDGDPTPATYLASAAGGILFAVHPICSEALLAHGAFPIVLATLLGLIAVLLAARAGSGEGQTRPFASAIFYLAALLSDAAIWPIALPAAALAGGARGDGGRSGFWRRVAPYLLMMALFYVCWSARSWPAISPLALRRPWSFSEGIASQSAAFLSELRLLVLPWGMSVDHGSASLAGVWNAQALTGGALLAIVLIGGFVYGLRASLASLALGWYSLSHLHLLIVPPEEPLSERRLYPLVVSIALAGASAVRWLERRGASRVALAAAALVSMIFAVGTVRRVDLWMNPEALWQSAALVNAASPRPHIALANLALGRDQIDLALQSFEAALARAPRSASIQQSIAEIYFRKGDYQRALQEVNKAMDLDPSYFPAYMTAGNSFMMRHQPKDAFLAFNAALRLRPKDPSALFNMGVLLFDQNRFTRAAELLQMASEGRPRDPDILFRLGMARINTGDLTGASEALRGCLAEAPDRLDARINLGSVLTQMKHYEEAGQILTSVLGSDPGNEKAFNGLGVLASAQEQWGKAREYFEKARAQDPNDLRTLYNLAGIYERTGEKEKAIGAYREFLSEWKGGLDTGEDARDHLSALEAARSR